MIAACPRYCIINQQLLRTRRIDSIPRRWDAVGRPQPLGPPIPSIPSIPSIAPSFQSKFHGKIQLHWRIVEMKPGGWNWPPLKQINMRMMPRDGAANSNNLPFPHRPPFPPPPPCELRLMGINSSSIAQWEH